MKDGAGWHGQAEQESSFTIAEEVGVANHQIAQQQQQEQKSKEQEEQTFNQQGAKRRESADKPQADAIRSSAGIVLRRLRNQRIGYTVT